MSRRPLSRRTGFTLVEIMIVVLIIGILLAIAIPNFVAARESSRAKACIGNLKQIDSASQQFCMDKQVSASNYATKTPALTVNDGTAASLGLIGANGYIRAMPVCPSSGNYTVATDITKNPQCDVSGDGSTGATADYKTGGKFYHGL